MPRMRKEIPFRISRKSTRNVIPAKAGIWRYPVVAKALDPAPAPDSDPGCAGVTTSYGFINPSFVLFCRRQNWAPAALLAVAIAR
jgi:hypothetical protein